MRVELCNYASATTIGSFPLESFRKEASAIYPLTCVFQGKRYRWLLIMETKEDRKRIAELFHNFLKKRKLLETFHRNSGLPAKSYVLSTPITTAQLLIATAFPWATAEGGLPFWERKSYAWQAELAKAIKKGILSDSQHEGLESVLESDTENLENLPK